MSRTTPIKTLIYGLVDPRTRTVRYVGKSSDGLTRPATHRLPSVLKTYEGSTRTLWIQELQALGLDYEVVVLETVEHPLNAGNVCWWRSDYNPTKLTDLECWWIAYGRACGWDLTNSTDGGEGVTGLIHTDETRMKISESSVHRVFTDSHKTRISNAKKGVPKTDDHKNRIKASRHTDQRSVSVMRKRRAVGRYLGLLLCGNYQLI